MNFLLFADGPSVNENDGRYRHCRPRTGVVDETRNCRTRLVSVARDHSTTFVCADSKRSPQRPHTLEPSCQGNSRTQHPGRRVVPSTRYRTACLTSNWRTRRRRSPLASACRFIRSLPPYAANRCRPRVWSYYFEFLEFTFVFCSCSRYWENSSLDTCHCYL